MKREIVRVLYENFGLQEPHGGVSRYFTEVIKRLPPNIQPIIAVRETRNAYLTKPPFNLPYERLSFNTFFPKLKFRGKSHVYRACARLLPNIFPGSDIINDNAFRQELAKGEFDVLHITHPHPENILWKMVVGKKPIVVTVHDLIPEMLQGNAKVGKARKEVLETASAIIAVSENTKSDIIRLYGISPEKIKVIYHGRTKFERQDGKSPFGDMRYVLYVGKRGGYKNSDFFFSAMAPMLRDDRGLNIVCTGRPFDEAEMALFAREGISGQIHQRFIPDSSMKSLFENAQCFVYPSIYEGFGIPILDAFDAGCPVVLSNCSCFPEVARDAALYFDQSDADGLRSCVSSLMHDGQLRNEYISKGKSRVSSFSWDECAASTIAVYRGVCS